MACPDNKNNHVFILLHWYSSVYLMDSCYGADLFIGTSQGFTATDRKLEIKLKKLINTKHQTDYRLQIH